MTFSKFISIGVLGLAGLLSACAAKGAEMAVQKTEYSSDYVKPGAAISYSHNLKSQLNAGEIATFELNLTEDYSDGTLQVSLSTEGGVSIASSATQFIFDMKDDGAHKVTISVAGNANGRHYLNVKALAVNLSGQSRPRIFSIPVQVGPVTEQKPNVDMKTMEDDENIIEMEAEEEIK